MERGSTSKRRPNFDYISSMPDPILQRILSLLETREAVQTCILSKRWINVWTSLSSLSFDFPFIRSEPFSKRHGDKTDEVVFERFVSMVLHRREPCDLHRFNLNTRYAWSIDDGCIMEWIHYALRHNVSKLHFSTSTFKSLPILNCSSLEELQLGFRYGSSGDEVINLPNLKELNLTGFILDASFSKRFFLGCPELEYLSLEDCPFENCHLSSNKLKRLRINFISSIDDFGFVASKNFGVRISAPNLTFICFHGEPEMHLHTEKGSRSIDGGSTHCFCSEVKAP
ncbi:F-box family protein [Rhynchospora pubera]|uniref:F-box family protein n=1 Tax=Rhynchospora pubera TaxID=906938 RepID=A0AAV8DDG4_9POAL|nr:F-box family protein [Rhynchospora pubera]